MLGGAANGVLRQRTLTDSTHAGKGHSDLDVISRGDDWSAGTGTVTGDFNGA